MRKLSFVLELLHAQRTHDTDILPLVAVETLANRWRIRSMDI